MVVLRAITILFLAMGVECSTEWPVVLEAVSPSISDGYNSWVRPIFSGEGHLDLPRDLEKRR